MPDGQKRESSSAGGIERTLELSFNKPLTTNYFIGEIKITVLHRTTCNSYSRINIFETFD